VIWTTRETLIAAIRPTEHSAPDLMVRLRTIMDAQKSCRKPVVKMAADVGRSTTEVRAANCANQIKIPATD
jgi:hypothetical protein